MFFYAVLVVLALGLVALLIRSPIVRQLRRGRGTDPAQFPGRIDYALYRKANFKNREPKPREWD